jgi:DivIVA domain-containing protein
MAISFSRPDPSSPAAVGSAAFPTSRRGFDQAEVRDFLKMVAAEMARLQERERFLESEMRAMQTRGLSAPGRLDEETVTTLLGEEAARVLTAARDASTQIRDRAEESATRLVKDAAEDAVRMPNLKLKWQSNKAVTWSTRLANIAKKSCQNYLVVVMQLVHKLNSFFMVVIV